MSKISITKTFTFDSAHQLTDLKGSKCQNLHGHTYKLEVTVSGKVQGVVPMIMDLSLLSTIVKGILEVIDHTNLNTFFSHSNPTAEYMAEWFAEEIQQHIEAYYPHSTMPIVTKITLWETPTGCATWEA